jgi:NADH-quinone oxidoreductase subunit K
VIHLWLPMVLAAVLAGAGTYGVLARRNAVLVLIGVELILNAANVMLVALGAKDDSPLQTGQSLTLFVITIAAAEICVALAVVLAMFRLQGHIDLTRPPELGAADDADRTEDTAHQVDPQEAGR